MTQRYTAFALIMAVNLSASSLPGGRILCPALAGIGLPTRPWNQLDKDDGQCISEMVPFGPQSFLRSNLGYQVTGKTINSIDAVSITANINTIASKDEGRKRVLTAVQQWFKAVGQPIPIDLEGAISTDKPLKSKSKGLTFRYEAEQSGKTFMMRFRAKDKDF